MLDSIHHLLWSSFSFVKLLWVCHGRRHFPPMWYFCQEEGNKHNFSSVFVSFLMTKANRRSDQTWLCLEPFRDHCSLHIIQRWSYLFMHHDSQKNQLSSCVLHHYLLEFLFLDQDPHKLVGCAVDVVCSTCLVILWQHFAKLVVSWKRVMKSSKWGLVLRHVTAANAVVLAQSSFHGHPHHFLVMQVKQLRNWLQRRLHSSDAR